MHFSSLGLSASIIERLIEQGYEAPTPVQVATVPAILAGRDVMATAPTGTGKTAAFTLPLLDLLSNGKRPRGNQIRALILTPSRELAAQIGDSVITYGRHLSVRSAVVFGGVKINPQMMKLRGGTDLLVATPGRLLDLYRQNAVKFDQLEVLVLDEADRMLDLGFANEVSEVVSRLPVQRQNLMFSATFSEDIRALARGVLNNPVEVLLSPRNALTSDIEQWVYPVDKNKKTALLKKIICEMQAQQVLVFSRTKQGANRLSRQLDAVGISSAAIHGDKSQSARTNTLANFKQGKVAVLVATDVAARGLDIEHLSLVVNFDLPNVPEDYIHRIGRTGRAGAGGQAVSLVDADEFKTLFIIERLIKRALPRREIEGFLPDFNVPPSPRDFRPMKPKKPKKLKTENKSKPGVKQSSAKKNSLS